MIVVEVNEAEWPNTPISTVFKGNLVIPID